jgi:hypothetical protein
MMSKDVVDVTRQVDRVVVFQGSISLMVRDKEGSNYDIPPVETIHEDLH